ncbi:MAG TPA: hypothetical protein VGV39_01060 [Mesorhizobium sp.]|jgi:hypothetical protein|uniref:hypothetical protein n=1 Tax=Mesorhizobium sp. TaxID=1871066 RepID=UPI002DDD54DD|nr:hypothetical protein [Mesorhizobium sp.]HEV2501631.1 hypothetical protein [Mesorhizobium sp.]
MNTLVRKIECALAEAIKYRIAGCDISADTGGELIAVIYHHGCPSENGGSAIAEKVNLTGLAIDIERALS